MDMDIECDGCSAPVKSWVGSGEYYPTYSSCDFCRKEQQCSGHTVWRGTELVTLPCSETATVYDTEDRGFYCEKGWRVLHEGEDLQDMEEFALRIPEDTP